MITLTSDGIPEHHRAVIVAGGVAMWNGGEWISLTGDSCGRPVQWRVLWWMPLLYDCDVDFNAKSLKARVCSPAASDTSATNAVQTEIDSEYYRALQRACQSERRLDHVMLG